MKIEKSWVECLSLFSWDIITSGELKSGHNYGDFTWMKGDSK